MFYGRGNVTIFFACVSLAHRNLLRKCILSKQTTVEKWEEVVSAVVINIVEHAHPVQVRFWTVCSTKKL